MVSYFDNDAYRYYREWNLLIDIGFQYSLRKIILNRYDLRIDYRDLNNVTSLNVLDSADKGKIWYPKLGFTNALGPFQTQMDDLTSGVLIREGDPIKEDVTLAIEG